MGYISVHLHPPTIEFLEGFSTSLSRMAGGLTAEQARHRTVPIEEFIADMDAHDIDQSVILPVDSRTRFRDEVVPNEWVSSLVKRYPDRIIGFCSVDPSMGEEAIRGLEHAVTELGLVGLKLDATKQGWDPTDRKHYPLFERAQE
ncbi:amidohydrolase family protein, partial [Microbacterium sp.]|uniref:amidohydrolase family protein n=1 Tax=Microbacterium sp. TaxID=51671 RepID=UPI002732BE79